MPTTKTKVFCVGFHKTGTTSVGKAMELLGFRNVHGAGRIRNKLGDLKTMELLFRKDYRPFFELANAYDSFNDTPWFKLYRELDCEFPSSKFILTLRDEDSWIRSVNKFFGGGSSPMRWWIYGRGCPLADNDRYLDIYRKHNKEVMEYFSKRKDDLLVLHLNSSDKMGKISGFLNLPKSSDTFPHLNKSCDH